MVVLYRRRNKRKTNIKYRRLFRSDAATLVHAKKNTILSNNQARYPWERLYTKHCMAYGFPNLFSKLSNYFVVQCALFFLSSNGTLNRIAENKISLVSVFEDFQ